MAKAFNLTAQINLQGPANIRPIVSNIKKQFSDIKADLKLNIDPKANTKIASITKGIQSLKTSIDAATVSVNKLNIGLTTLGSSLGKIQSISGTVNNSIGKVSTSSKSAAKAAREAATEIQAFGDAAGLALKRFAAFSAVSTVIYGLVNSINDAVSEFIVYDRELVRLSQVTGDTINQFGQFSVGIKNIDTEIRRLSTSLGVSSQDLIKAASTLAQAGLSADETKVALEALAKSALAPSFDDITQTVEGSIAALRQFGLGVGDLETALGSINQVSADFAVESDDIIKAIQRTGGVFASASRGVSSGTDALNEFIAVFTSVRATTRESAETIATGLRTIFTRIQRGTTVDALKELGVELRDGEGKFVGAFEAVRRLSEGLSSIDPRSGTFSEIVEELGGFRQIGKVIPLIQQFGTAQEALQSAQRGGNSLTDASVKALFSLENQLSRTREEFLALISEFAQSGTIKTLTVSTLALTRSFISVVGALKPLLPLITTLATIKLSQKIPEFIGGGGRVGFLSGLFKGSAGALTTPAATTAPTTSTATAQQAVSVSSNTQAITALTTAIKNLTAVIQTRPGRTGFATGGLVGGVGSRDTVPAMLTPGEFVIRKKAVQSIGADNLRNINRYAPGGKVKDLINNKKGKYLSNTYDTDRPLDTYSPVTIDKSPILQSDNKIATYGKYRDAAEKHLKQARKIYRNDGVDAANAFLSEQTNGLIAKMPENHLDNTSLKPVNKIQGALAEKDVQANLEKQKLGPQKLPYIAGADFAIDGKNAFVEVKNKKKSTSDKELITKALLGYAKIYGSLNPVKNTLTGKTRKIKGFRDGKKNNISGLNITLYSTNPKDVIQEKNLGGIIRKFAVGGSSKDTVPALLTPGEFVIRKEAAQKLGSATLHKMNNADKLQGYNKGGFVGGKIVQRFEDGGDVEATIQTILISMEKAVKAAEQRAYRETRSPQFAPTREMPDERSFFAKLRDKLTGREPKVSERGGAMISEGGTARDALAAAREAAKASAREFASAAKAQITARTGTDYTRVEAMRAKEDIDAALKRMIRGIETGKDVSVKGETERRRTPGYMEPATPPAPTPGTASPELSDEAKDTSESMKDVADQSERFQQRLTNMTLVVTNMVLPQLKDFATQLKITDNAFGSAAVQAGELGASLALSANLGLQAVGASKRQTQLTTAAAGVAGVIGGGFQGFATKTLENAIKDNSKALSSFDKVLRDVQEAPTDRLRIEAAAQLDKELINLAENTEQTAATIANAEFYEKLGGIITNTTSTFISLNTSVLAFTGALSQSTLAVKTKVAADAASSAAGATAAGAGIMGTLGKVGAGLLKFNIAIQVITGLLSLGISLYSAWNSASGRSIEVMRKLGASIEAVIKNGNNYSLANKRYTNETIKSYRVLKANLSQLPKEQRAEREQAIFGGTQRVSTTTGQVDEASVSAGKLSNSFNQFNLVLDQYIRQELQRQGLYIGTEQTLSQFEQSLGEGSERAKRFNAIINELANTSNKGVTEFEKFAYIMSLTEPTGGVAPLSSVEAEQRFNKELNSGAIGLINIRRAGEAYSASVSKNKIQVDELTDTMKAMKISSLNMIDILNRVNSSLQRINTDVSNAFDDAVYNFQLSTEDNPNIRGDVSAARQAEILRNLPAATSTEIEKAMNAALDVLDLNRNELSADGKSFQEYADTLRKNVLALQIAEKDIPIALRQFSESSGAERDPGALKETIREIIKPIGLEPDISSSLLDAISASVEKSTGGEGTLDLDKLIGDIPALVKNLDVFKMSSETAAKVLDNVTEKGKRVAEVANIVANSLNKVQALEIQSAQLRLNTSLEVNKILGRSTGFQAANAPFDAAINRLTQSIGGTLDPAVIGRELQKKITTLQETPPTGINEQAILKQEINSLNQALSMLGDKNDRLVNALDALRQTEEERKGIGSIFEETVKASRDPIARMDLQATMQAAQRVQAGGTNTNDLIRVLDKYIPMLEKAGGRFAEQGAQMRQDIQSRMANIGATQALQAGDLGLAAFGKYLALFLGQQVATPQQRTVQTEVDRSNAAIQERIKIENGAQAALINQAINLTNFDNSLKMVLPSIIKEMQDFKDQLAKQNAEANAVEIPKTNIDIQNVYDTINEALLKQFASTGIDGFQLGPGDKFGGPGGFSRPRTQPELSPMMRRYYDDSGKPIDVSGKGLGQLETLMTDLIFVFEKNNKELASELKIQQENLREYNKVQQQRNVAPNTPPIPTARPALPPSRINPRFGVRDVMNDPDFMPPPQPVGGGGAFMIPPEPVRATAQAANITATKTKLDFDYNDFITKFSRAFDTQTGKFRNVIQDLSLAFPALNAPIDKFSKSVTTLIDGLNAINDAGGIKGPNIPDKVTIEVVFNEDLTIDTSRINNNDLLNQIGVVTTQAVQAKFNELKLTGQV